VVKAVEVMVLLKMPQVQQELLTLVVVVVVVLLVQLLILGELVAQEL